MSGTSLDGIDGVVLELSKPGRMRVSEHVHRPFDASLRDELMALQRRGTDEIHRSALAGNALARAYSDVVGALLDKAKLPALAIQALGAHGQTVRHQPGLHDGTGYTTQLLQGALLAELTGVDVVCDFRSRDVAAGGQGAPLVPAFHQAAFGREDVTTAVLNVGGMANISLLKPDVEPLGFDTGPGGALLDLWCSRHRGMPFDRDGAWAASGTVDDGLLRTFLDEAYFSLPAPKSTGRDLFDSTWLDARLAAHGHPVASVDVQATLSELTAASAANAALGLAPEAAALIVCGGGARNGDLLMRLRRRIHAQQPDMEVTTSDTLGLPAEQVEAAAFAWLAHRFMMRQPGNVPAVTGAKGLRVLGALHPAR